MFHREEEGYLEDMHIELIGMVAGFIGHFQLLNAIHYGAVAN
jgi:hypothetical protein